MRTPWVEAGKVARLGSVPLGDVDVPALIPTPALP